MTSLDTVSQASVAPLKLDPSMMGKTLLTPLSSFIIRNNKYFTLSTWVGMLGLIFMFASCSKNKELERDKQLIADYIAEKNGIPLDKDFVITEAQLDDAILNYVTDTKLDNSMTAMLSSLIDKKGFLKQMNKKALSVIPPAVVGAATLKAQLNNSKSKRKQ